MDRALAGHMNSVEAARALNPVDAPAREVARTPTFECVYELHFDFVWRSVRRLGVHPSAVEDVVQDVFVVVHRRLPTFRGDAPLRSWLFAITARTVGDFRRTLRRKPAHLGGRARAEDAMDFVVDPASPPDETAAAAQAAQALDAVLARMDECRRIVFVLAELEEMTVPEIAAATGANVNTVYSRLRAARAEFDQLARAARGQFGGGGR